MLSLDCRVPALRASCAAALGLAIMLLTVACGSNVAAQAAPAGPSDAGSAVSGGAQSFTVNMNDANQFVPASLTVPRGATVTWTNIGQVTHTVTADPTKAIRSADVSLPSGVQPWDSGNIDGGQSFSHTFDAPGTYRYVCIPHEVLGMIGTITVTD